MPSETPKTLHSATWWRGKVTVETTQSEEVIVPGRKTGLVTTRTISPIEGKLVPYNPFEFYFPDLRTKHRRAISLYHHFVAVDPLNLNEVQSFCEEFGVLGNPKETWEQWDQGSPYFRELFPQEDYGDPLSYRMRNKDSQSAHAGLCIPLSLHEFQLERSAMDTALQHIQKVDQRNTPKQAKQEARGILEEQLRGEFTKVRQSPRWDGQKKMWVSHWDSLSLVSLMYQMLWLDLLGPGKNVQCEKCGNPFLAQHPRAEYCTERCRNTSKKARQRQKQKKTIRIQTLK